MKNNKQIRSAIIWIVVAILYSLCVFADSATTDTSCTAESCVVTIYAQEQNYQDNAVWKPIDETIQTEDCVFGYDYCVNDNLYQLNMEATYGETKISYGENDLSFTMASLGPWEIQDTNGVATENQIVYTDVIGGIDVQYTYLPTLLKEDIILKNKGFCYTNHDFEGKEGWENIRIDTSSLKQQWQQELSKDKYLHAK